MKGLITTVLHRSLPPGGGSDLSVRDTNLLPELLGPKYAGYLHCCCRLLHYEHDRKGESLPLSAWVMSFLVPQLTPNKNKPFLFQETPNTLQEHYISIPELSIILHSDSDLFSLTLADFLPFFRAADRETDRQTDRSVRLLSQKRHLKKIQFRCLGNNKNIFLLGYTLIEVFDFSQQRKIETAQPICLFSLKLPKKT